MGISRTIIALVVLFAGIMTLLVLRYDPWLIATLIDNPLLTVPLVAVLAALLGSGAIHTVPDPKRGVVFYEERFDRIDPRGRIPLLPGVERVGAEIPLDEQRVLGWPVLLYDRDGKEQMVAFSLTWRLVPQSARPENGRERRVLLMSNAERQHIVLQTLESILRDITRNLSLEDLKAVLSDPDCIEAIRGRLCQRLDKDTLTVDRLHMLRVAPPEKKEEPKAARETHTLTQTRDWKGEVQGGSPSLWRGLLPGSAAGSPPLNQVIVQAGQTPAAAPAPEAKSGGEPATAVVHEEIKRVDEVVRGAKETSDARGGTVKASLTVEDHTRILTAIVERLSQVQHNMTQSSVSMGERALLAALQTLPADDLVRSRIAAVLRVLPVLRDVNHPMLLDTVTSISRQLPYSDPPAVARALREKGEGFKKLGDTVMADALQLAARLVQDGTATLYSARYYQGQLGQQPGAHLPPVHKQGEAVKQVLREDVEGVLMGVLLGTMIVPVVTQSSQLAALVAPELAALSAQDGGIARAVESSAAAIVEHLGPWVR